MKNEKVKVICVVLTAAMLIGSCPSYIYASETGGDIEINPGVNEREGADLIPGDPNATDLENDDTDNIKDKTQSNEDTDDPEGYVPDTVNGYDKDAATPIEGYEVPDEYIQYLRATTVAGEWIKSGSRWWYRHNDGTYTKNGWEWIYGNWYYFNADGWMVTGWVKSGGKWYYCNENGKMATNWNIIDGVWYYFNTDGSMATNWNKIGGKWYYFKSSGAMVTNWNLIGGEWYYFDSDGVMQTGWLLKGGVWYYLQSSGAMVTGWKWIDSKCYYFDYSGAMLTGWIETDDDWYYCNSSGAWTGVESDSRGCSHGRATYGNLKASFKSSRIGYINNAGTKYNSTIIQGTSRWSSISSFYINTIDPKIIFQNYTMGGMYYGITRFWVGNKYVNVPEEQGKNWSYNLVMLNDSKSIGSSVITHEIGHCLGLAHKINDYGNGSLMKPEGYISYPSSQDFSDVNHIYSYH